MRTTHGVARGLVVALAFVSAACATPTLTERRETAAPAISALQRGAFEQAGEDARAKLASDGTNPYARLVRAIVTYESSMRALSLDVRTLVIGGAAAGGINHPYLRTSLEKAEAALARVEDDLAVVNDHPDLAVELCVACWDIDWNGNGRVDARDHVLLEIEQDEKGEPIPAGDPRRRPTFRFDHGDVAWARAFVSFQRALIDLVLAYDWSGLDPLIASRGRQRGELVLRLAHAEKVRDARRLLLEGLARSDEARRAYLAETDDDREWMPNPRQKSHPMPLPVDQPLYDTWEAAIRDLTRLVRGDEGLSLADVARLLEPGIRNPPGGYLDIGGLLAHPKDLVVNPGDLERFDRTDDVAGMARSVLGSGWKKEMSPSPLPSRLARMKAEVDRNDETFERKLRYFLWVN